ncbi:MAG: hypothetical protein C4522_10375 [Desulfobacteraceae bacterium]|nr:MAG: hypothetical protein C4522_10375 [Desulfobacteraceae bacterium]
MGNKDHTSKFVIVAAIYFAVILIFALFIRDWLAAQTIAVVLTGVVLIWYTIETQLLRKESQKQTEIQIRPFVIVELKNRKFYLKNLGHGPALNVKIRPVQVSSEESIIIKFGETVPTINPGETIELKVEGFHHGNPTGDFFTAHLNPEYANRNLSIFIDYQNIDLVQYTTRERVSPKKWEIVEYNN